MLYKLNSDVFTIMISFSYNKSETLKRLYVVNKAAWHQLNVTAVKYDTWWLWHIFGILVIECVQNAFRKYLKIIKYKINK